MDIAVVIPTYNHSEYISTALESVLAQSRPPDEIVVTDDGSEDATVSIVEEYAQNYSDIIKTRFSEKNNGIPHNLNEGLRAVSADAVTFLAGDDRFRSKKLEEESLKLRSKDEIGVVYSNFVYVSPDGVELELWTDSSPPQGDVLKECLVRQWPKTTLFRNPLVSTNILNQVGLFDESFPIYEDWDMKIRLSAITKIAYCDNILTEYRQHPGGISSQSDAALHARMFEKILQKHSDKIQQLDCEDRHFVERKLGSQLHQHQAFANLERGDKRAAATEYIAAMQADPQQLLAYKNHLKILLPENLFQQLVRAKQFVDSVV